MPQSLYGCPDIGMYCSRGQRVIVTAVVGFEYRFNRRTYPVEDRAQVRRRVRLVAGQFPECRHDRAAIRVPKYDDELRAKLLGCVFDAADLRGRNDVAGNTNDKQVAEALVKNRLDRDPGVGAGEYDGKRTLTVGHPGPVYTLRYFRGIDVAGNEAAIAIAKPIECISSGYHAGQYLAPSPGLQALSAASPPMQEYGRTGREVRLVPGQFDIAVGSRKGGKVT